MSCEDISAFAEFLRVFSENTGVSFENISVFAEFSTWSASYINAITRATIDTSRDASAIHGICGTNGCGGKSAGC